MVREFIRAHDLLASEIHGTHVVFDAPPEFCGTVVVLSNSMPPRGWVRGLADRGWCVVTGTPSEIVRRLSILYAQNAENPLS